jgi:hypothetical protein
MLSHLWCVVCDIDVCVAQPVLVLHSKRLRIRTYMESHDHSHHMMSKGRGLLAIVLSGHQVVYKSHIHMGPNKSISFVKHISGTSISPVTAVYLNAFLGIGVCAPE